MKKFVSILLLLFYANVVFGTHINCHYCEGKLVDVELKGIWETGIECPFDHRDMGCCKTESASCKSEIHAIQNSSCEVFSLFGNSVNHVVQNGINYIVLKPTLINQSGYYYLIKWESSRQILSRIHTLRI